MAHDVWRGFWEACDNFWGLREESISTSPKLGQFKSSTTLIPRPRSVRRTCIHLEPDLQTRYKQTCIHPADPDPVRALKAFTHDILSTEAQTAGPATAYSITGIVRPRVKHCKIDQGLTLPISSPRTPPRPHSAQQQPTSILRKCAQRGRTQRISWHPQVLFTNDCG